MNNNCVGRITVLQTWDWEEFELNLEYNNFLELYNSWAEGVNLSEYRRFLKFSNLKTFFERKVWLSLPEAKKQKKLYEMWSEEKRILLEKNPEKYYELEREDNERRQKIAEIIAENKILSSDRRQEIRLEKRLNFLKELEKLEKNWGLETTLSQLERLRKLENEERKRILENKN